MKRRARWRRTSPSKPTKTSPAACRPGPRTDAAVRKVGNATRVREEIYWMNTVRPIDTIWQDLKYAARLLKRDKGFAVAAILSLALGIDANTANLPASTV
ncbi:MAG: hypothetical protein K2Y23_15155 [Cyanobacteria bacterium]|nr:hypothetical protein [Cyanobacteriota bacterium]